MRAMASIQATLNGTSLLKRRAKASLKKLQPESRVFSGCLFFFEVRVNSGSTSQG